MITQIPTPVPSTEDTANFDPRADATLGALPQFIDELNNFGSVVALGLNGASTSSMTIAEGSHSITTTSTGRGWFIGMGLIAAVRTNPTTQMLLIVTAYNPLTGALEATTPAGQTAGSGTYSDWVLGPAPATSSIGKQGFWLPAPAWMARITNGAPLNAFETATNKWNFRTLDHDKTTKEYAQASLLTGNSWDAGTITGRPVVSHAAAAGSSNKVAFGLRAVALSSGAVLDTAPGTAQYSNMILTAAAGSIDIGPETPPITVAGGPSKGDMLLLEEFRYADDATNDTLDEDARLHGWFIYLTLDQGTDA